MKSILRLLPFLIFVTNANADTQSTDFRQPFSFQFLNDLNLKRPEKDFGVLTVGMNSVTATGKKSAIPELPGDSPDAPFSNCVLKKENLSGLPNDVIAGKKTPGAKTWGIHLLRIEKGQNFKFFTRKYDKLRITTDRYTEFFEIFNSMGERLELKCRVSCTEIVYNNREPDRHCGDFISGSTVSLLEKLGVKDAGSLRLPVDPKSTSLKTALGSAVKQIDTTK